MHYFYLIQFNIKVQLHANYILFIRILDPFFPDLITEGRTDERMDSRNEKYATFYNIVTTIIRIIIIIFIRKTCSAGLSEKKVLQIDTPQAPSHHKTGQKKHRKATKS